MRNYYCTDINALEEEIQSKRDFKNAISVNTRRIDCTMSGLSENEYSGADADAIREGMSVMVKETFPRQMDLVDVTISMLEDLRDGYCECKKFGDEIGTIFDVGDLYTPSGKVICDIEKIEALRSFCDEIFARQHEMLDALQEAKSNLESVDNPKWELIAKAEDVISALNKLDVFDDYRILVGKYAEKVVNMDDIAVARIREIIPTRAHNYVQKPARIKQKLSKSKVQGLLDVKTSSGRLKDIKGLSGTKGGFSGLKGLGGLKSGLSGIKGLDGLKGRLSGLKGLRGGSYRMQTLYAGAPNTQINTITYAASTNVQTSSVADELYVDQLSFIDYMDKSYLTEDELHMVELLYNRLLNTGKLYEVLCVLEKKHGSLFYSLHSEFLMAKLYAYAVDTNNCEYLQFIFDELLMYQDGCTVLNVSKVSGMMRFLDATNAPRAYFSMNKFMHMTISDHYDNLEVYLRDDGNGNKLLALRIGAEGGAIYDEATCQYYYPYDVRFVDMNERLTQDDLQKLYAKGFTLMEIRDIFTRIATDEDEDFVTAMLCTDFGDLNSTYDFFLRSPQGLTLEVGKAMALYMQGLYEKYDYLYNKEYINFCNAIICNEARDEHFIGKSMGYTFIPEDFMSNRMLYLTCLNYGANAILEEKCLNLALNITNPDYLEQYRQWKCIASIVGAQKGTIEALEEYNQANSCRIEKVTKYGEEYIIEFKYWQTCVVMIAVR